MTINVDEDPRFEFDKADRLRRAMRVANLSVQELAARLDVSRNTVGNWINGRNEPRRRDLRGFAMATGFPIAWLETGQGGPDNDGGQPGVVHPPGLEPGTHWLRVGRPLLELVAA